MANISSRARLEMVEVTQEQVFNHSSGQFQGNVLPTLYFLPRAPKPWNSASHGLVEVDQTTIVVVWTEVENVAVTNHQAQAGIACVARMAGLQLTLRPPVELPENADGTGGINDFEFCRTDIMPLEPVLS